MTEEPPQPPRWIFRGCLFAAAVWLFMLVTSLRDWLLGGARPDNVQLAGLVFIVAGNAWLVWRYWPRAGTPDKRTEP